ncbi:MAG: MarR family transcriptional regulator [Clostridia bacterium]|nr:MarR family transcriptional regulator [Clostridia bacterium]
MKKTNKIYQNYDISLLALIRWVNSEYEENVAKKTTKNKILNQRAVRSVLKILSMNTGISQNDLAREVHLKGSTISIALTKMENEELIKRVESDSDKRKVNVFLTAKGYDLMKETDALVESVEEEMLVGLSESEKYELKSTLRKILLNC